MELHKDCATSEQVLLAAASAERIALEGHGEIERNGLEARLVSNQNGAQDRAAIERNGMEARLLSRSESHENRENVNRNGHETRDRVEKNGFEDREVSRREGHETREDVDRFGFHNANKTELFGLKNFEAIKDALKDVLLQACGNTDRIVCNENANAKEMVLQAANNAAAIQAKLCHLELQQAKDAAAIQLEAAKNFAHLQLQAAQNTAKIELDAARHTAELAKQIAECCCENKSLVIEKANQTDMLIRKLDEDRVRDQRDALREELIACRLRSTLLPLPVAATTV